MGGYYYDPGIMARSQSDTAQPAFNLILFVALTGIPDDDVQCFRAEEELVSYAIDLLTAEVPASQCHVQVEVGVAEDELRYLDTVRREAPFNKRSSSQRGH